MNVIFGRPLFGRRIFAGTVGVRVTSYFAPDILPATYALIVYNKSGQKIATFDSDIAYNPVVSFDFELNDTGCGDMALTLGHHPADIQLDYGMRIDVHLFGDVQPWYSGYVTEKPLPGTTQQTLQYKIQGYYAQLENVLVNGVYTNMDIADIVQAIAMSVIEPETDIVYNGGKIRPTGYVASKLRFDYVTAKDALKQLAEFAVDYIYGVDAYRELYFKPLNTDVNEQARLWVGQHVTTFEPSEDIDAVVNCIYVKSATMDTQGSNIKGPYQDSESQALYGVLKKVLSAPSAVDQADVDRWAASQLQSLKTPNRKATVKGLSLLTKGPDGKYVVRKLVPEGQAVIYAGENSYTFSIEKIKYAISANGISCSLDLGKKTDKLDAYIVKLQRDIKNAEFIQSLNDMQLKGVTI